MVWDKLKEMDLYDKISDDLKMITSKDSSAVEKYVTDSQQLQFFKECLHRGMDSRTIGEHLGLTINQVDIIKELLGKIG